MIETKNELYKCEAVQVRNYWSFERERERDEREKQIDNQSEQAKESQVPIFCFRLFARLLRSLTQCIIVRFKFKPH